MLSEEIEHIGKVIVNSAFKVHSELGSQNKRWNQKVTSVNKEFVKTNFVFLCLCGK
jgi:hypothetical protein